MPTDAGSGLLHGARILIVEDDFIVARSLEFLLSTCGCEVVGIAPTAADALALIGDRPCDAAILDVNLRGGSCAAAASLRSPSFSLNDARRSFSSPATPTSTCCRNPCAATRGSTNRSSPRRSSRRWTARSAGPRRRDPASDGGAASACSPPPRRPAARRRWRCWDAGSCRTRRRTAPRRRARAAGRQGRTRRAPPRRLSAPRRRGAAPAPPRPASRRCWRCHR